MKDSVRGTLESTLSQPKMLFFLNIAVRTGEKRRRDGGFAVAKGRVGEAERTSETAESRN